MHQSWLESKEHNENQFENFFKKFVYVSSVKRNSDWMFKILKIEIIVKIIQCITV